MNKIPKSDALIIVFVSVVTVIIDLAIAVILGVIVSVSMWQQGKIIKAINQQIKISKQFTS